MKKRNSFSLIERLIVVAILASLPPLQAGETTTGGPLKVYILAGQSNMQGKARTSTLPYMAMSPETKPLYDKLVDEQGKPRIHKHVSIAAFSNDGPWGGPKVATEKHGQLTTGFGSSLKSDSALGPELAFGVTMQESVNEPILIIKTAWGGKSLIRDFRPPSAGLPALGEGTQKKWREAGTYDEEVAKRKEANGHYYRLMMKHVNTVLKDPGKYCPAYNPKQGYDIAGFVWFQGFNDMIGPYPSIGRRAKDYSEYSRLLAHLIRDVRSELKAPSMPFVIGVMGIDGEPNKKQASFREAMAAPALMPEFKNNVVAVPTARFWDHELIAAGEKARALHKLKRKPYRVTSDGTIDSKSIITSGWEAIGSPLPEKRIWHYVSYQKDPEDFYRKLKKGEPGDERFFKEDVPTEYEGWQKPDYDVTKWQNGVAPIGKGAFCRRTEAPKIHSKWGEGNMLLMRTSFELDTLDYEDFRLCIMANWSFNVYLNGHKIATYVWHGGQGHYRAYELTKEQRAHLKKGRNVLAVQSNVWTRKKWETNWVNAWIEGITTEGKTNLTKAYDRICPPRALEVAKGSSNQAYHYLGSAKIYSRIGEAFAKAITELNK